MGGVRRFKAFVEADRLALRFGNILKVDDTESGNFALKTTRPPMTEVNTASCATILPTRRLKYISSKRMISKVMPTDLNIGIRAVANAHANPAACRSRCHQDSCSPVVRRKKSRKKKLISPIKAKELMLEKGPFGRRIEPAKYSPPSCNGNKSVPVRSSTAPRAATYTAIVQIMACRVIKCRRTSKLRMMHHPSRAGRMNPSKDARTEESGSLAFSADASATSRKHPQATAERRSSLGSIIVLRPEARHMPISRTTITIRSSVMSGSRRRKER